MNRIILTVLALSISLFSGAKVVNKIEMPSEVTDILISDDAKYAVFSTKPDIGLFKAPKSELAVVSMESGDTLWTKKYHYLNDILIPSNQGLLVLREKEVICYDYISGNEKYKIKIFTTYLDSKNDKIVGYYKGKQNQIACFRLSDGCNLWTSKTDKIKSKIWEEALTQDSTSLIFFGDGIERVNLNTGELTRQDLKRSVVNKTENAGMLTLGIAGAVLGSPYVLSSTLSDPARIYSLGSDVVSDNGDCYYVSGKDGILCLDSTMNVRWSNSLRDYSCSKAHIFLNGDTLEFLNEGQGISGDRLKKYGKPFRASLNKHTGELIGLKEFPDNHDEKLFGKNIEYAEQSIYIFNPFIKRFSIKEHKPGEYEVYAADGRLLTVNDDFEVIGQTPYEYYMHKIEEFENGKTMISKFFGSDKYLIIDSHGSVVDTIRSDNSFCIIRGNIVFTIENGYLMLNEID